MPSVYWRARMRSLRSRARRSVAAVCARIESHNDFFYREVGVDRLEIEACSEARCRRLGIPVDRRMQSVHYAAFEALAASGFQPRNVLEVCTFRGYTACFLGDLFPDATIYTVELPEDDPLKACWLPWSDQEWAEICRRVDRPNVRWIRANTAFLFRYSLPKFDLIWQDTGDRFPEIGWEFYQSLAELAPGGWLFVDDVRRRDNPIIRFKDWYIHIYRTLMYYQARMPEKFRFLLKRKDPVLFQMDPKFIAFLRMGSGGAE